MFAVQLCDLGAPFECRINGKFEQSNDCLHLIADYCSTLHPLGF